MSSLSRQRARIAERMDAQIKADPFAYAAEWTPTFTLDRQIADARESMGEDRWAQLRAEFDAVDLSKEDYHG